MTTYICETCLKECEVTERYHRYLDDARGLKKVITEEFIESKCHGCCVTEVDESYETDSKRS